MARKTTLRREDWLAQALKVLRERGVEAVRIVPLAAQLGVSRGSFYWHFTNRRELLDAMLDHWEREVTDTVIEYVRAMQGGPADRIRAMMEFVLLRGLTRYDAPVRAWALSDPETAICVRRVDHKRIGFVSQLFEELGLERDEARARGRLLAVYLIGESAAIARESPGVRDRLLPRRFELLIRL